MACPKCKSKRGYVTNVKSFGTCKVDIYGNWVQDIEYTESEPLGPYTCIECDAEFEQLPEVEE